MRREFAIGHVVAEDVKVTVVELLVVLVVERAQRCSLVGLERGNRADEHGFRFSCRSGLGTSQSGTP